MMDVSEYTCCQLNVGSGPDHYWLGRGGGGRLGVILRPLALMSLMLFASALPKAALSRSRRQSTRTKSPKQLGTEMSPVQKAKLAFKAGQGFMRTRRYARAIVEFRTAYNLTHDGLVMGQIALAYEKAHDYKAALSAIEIYRDALPDADRASVDALRRKYKRRIKQGKSKTLDVPREEPPTLDEKKTPTPSENLAVSDPIQSEDSLSMAPEYPASQQASGRLWTWVAAGTSAALGVGALALGLSAQSKFNELDDVCGAGRGGRCAQSDIDSVKTRALVTDILWGGAAAAAVTATVLFFFEERSPGREESRAAPSDSDGFEEEEDDLVKRFTITPMAGSGLLGMGASFDY